MENFSETLSSDNEELLVIDNSPTVNQNSNHELAVGEDPNKELALYIDNLYQALSAFNFEEEEDSVELEEEQDLSLAEIGIHPLFLEERNAALTLLNHLLSTADGMLEELEGSMDGPICPYEGTLVEYLGPNYIIPTIHELTLPKDFSITKSISAIEEFSQKVDKKMIDQLDLMAIEAADTNFPGITSQNLGNAFSVLSCTAQGEEYVIDRQKLAQHLEFAEIIRNLPAETIEENPYLVAFKIVNRYAEITENYT